MGALIAYVHEEGEEVKSMPPVLLRKSDGGFLYATTDMATLQERVNDLKGEKMIYVIDARQWLHCEQVVSIVA